MDKIKLNVDHIVPKKYQKTKIDHLYIVGVERKIPYLKRKKQRKKMWYMIKKDPKAMPQQRGKLR